MNDTTSLRCELCKTPMTVQGRSGSPVRYFHCSHCGRWVASSYGEELVRAGTARVESQPVDESAADFERIKARLERWIHALDESDPYQVLGLPPSSSEEETRARFKELALANHPDRGGDPSKMRRVLTAYDRIRRGRRVATPCPAPQQRAPRTPTRRG